VRKKNRVGQTHLLNESAKYGCSLDVTVTWQTTVIMKEVLSSASNMRLLKKTVEFEHVCYRHARCMASHLGLSTNFNVTSAESSSLSRSPVHLKMESTN
jgi:hypothetical protein